MMLRALAVMLALLWGLPVQATQVDLVLKFANLAAAKADPAVQRYLARDDDGQDRFSGDTVIPNVRVWRASQDVSGVDADGNPTVTHSYLPGYYVLVSLQIERAAQVAALRDHDAILLAINRDKAKARQVGAIIKSTVSAQVLQDIRISPVFAGSEYPVGDWK